MTSEQLIVYIIMPLVGYLLGSIPFALVIGKAKGVDIRTVGSKNIGATNLGRSLGMRFFWYAFFLDAAKGFFPVLTAAILVRHWNYSTIGWTFVTPLSTTTIGGPMIPSWTPLLTAVACVLGHTFPLWLKFKGGKGVATSFGVLLGFWPVYTLAGLGGATIFVLVLLIYRYISLSSIVGVIGFAALVLILGTQRNWITYTPWSQLWPLLAVAALFSALIIVRHRGNISRLLKGTEPKVGSHRPPTNQP